MLGGNFNQQKDFEVNPPPTDGISSLSFSPKANYLVSGSWDNQVRCWEIQNNGQSVPKASISHDAPVLCTTFNNDGSRVFSGGCDNKVKSWTLQTNQNEVIGQHASPVKSVCFVESYNLVLSGSWDKTIKYWDCRSPNPAHSLQMPERVYSMDVKSALCVIATADRHVVIIDLRNPTKEFKSITSPLKYQTRTISCFPDSTGFAIGSIEGRVGIHYVDEKLAQKNFAFKCHREGNDVFPVNAIPFHPQFGTFATAGSDGTFHFWDKEAKMRIKQFSKNSGPISTATFNMDGSIFAYAVSYDWFKGSEYAIQGNNHIFLHPVTEAEIKKRK